MIDVHTSEKDNLFEAIDKLTSSGIGWAYHIQDVDMDKSKFGFGRFVFHKGIRPPKKDPRSFCFTMEEIKAGADAALNTIYGTESNLKDATDENIQLRKDVYKARRTDGPMELTQKEAACLCGVTPRTVKNWEAETGFRPLFYPGRYNLVTFSTWSNTYKSQKNTKRQRVGDCMQIDS